MAGRGGRFPVEPKVKAAGGAASLAAVAVQLVLHFAFRHLPPVWVPYVSHFIADGGLALLAGYRAPHQHRDLPAVMPPRAEGQTPA